MTVNIKLQNTGVAAHSKQVYSTTRVLESKLDQAMPGFTRKQRLYTDCTALQDNARESLVQESQLLINKYSAALLELIEAADRVPEVYIKPEFQKSFARIQTHFGHLYDRITNTEKSTYPFLTALRHESSARSKMDIYSTLVEQFQRENNSDLSCLLGQMLEEGYHYNRIDNGNTVLLKGFFGLPLTASEKIDLLIHIKPASTEAALHNIVLGQLAMRLNKKDAVFSYTKQATYFSQREAIPPYFVSLLQELVVYLNTNAR